MNKLMDISEFVDVLTWQKVSENLIARIQMRRKELKISRKELAKRSGVSYGSIRRFEETGNISLSSLLRIASILGYLEDFESLFDRPALTSLKEMFENERD